MKFNFFRIVVFLLSIMLIPPEAFGEALDASASCGRMPEPPASTNPAAELLNNVNNLTTIRSLGNDMATRIDISTTSAEYSTEKPDNWKKIYALNNDGYLDSITHITVIFKSGEILSIETLNSEKITYTNSSGRAITLSRDRNKKHSTINFSGSHWKFEDGSPIKQGTLAHTIKQASDEIYMEIRFPKNTESRYEASLKTFQLCQEKSIAAKKSIREKENIDPSVTDDFSGIRLGMTVSQAMAELQQHGYKSKKSVRPDREDNWQYTYYTVFANYGKTDKNGIEYSIIFQGSIVPPSQLQSWSTTSRVTFIHANFSTPHATRADAMMVTKARYPNGIYADAGLLSPRRTGVTIGLEGSPAPSNMMGAPNSNVLIAIFDVDFDRDLQARIFATHPEMKAQTPSPKF